ncbi:MAG: hypothetical protein KAK04_11715, partial [Cyclobacteriaceae bacterium]|nr:hypothetical protein [Cyclobacteriaceae bacterium]
MLLCQGWSGLFEPLPRRQAGEVGLCDCRGVATACPPACRRGRGTQIENYKLYIRMMSTPATFLIKPT